MTEEIDIVKMPHHDQHELCRTRPVYRQGRKLTAVKVYTVNDESQHLIICGVPKIQLKEEVEKIIAPYGVVKQFHVIRNYPDEEFTESYHLKYEIIQNARIAKRFLDGRNFFGGILHVCYAPELETVSETRKKLNQRRRDIAVRIKRLQEDSTNLETNEFEPRAQFHRQKKYPTLPLTEERLSSQYPDESFSSINIGIPKEIDPRPISEPSLPGSSSQTFLPHSKRKFEQESKDKNYKGRSMKEGNFVRVIRPKIIDTTKLRYFNHTNEAKEKEKKIFPVVKKVENGITIKLISSLDSTKKRIVMKNSSTSLVKPSSDLQSSIESAKLSIRDAMQKK